MVLEYMRKSVSKIGTILIIIATVILAGIAIFTAYRLYQLRQASVAPNVPSSKPAAATEPPTAETCINFANLSPGKSVEEENAVNPNLLISAEGADAVSIKQDALPYAYGAPNGDNKPGPNNGCLGSTGGFALNPAEDKSNIGKDKSSDTVTFTFPQTNTINKFSMTIRDWGDLNTDNATNHQAKLTAYDTAGSVIDSHEFSFVTQNADAKDGGDVGDLNQAGDACTASSNQPGNYTFTVAGENIAKVVFEGSSNVNSSKLSDPHVAFSNLCLTTKALSSCTLTFTISSTPTPTPTSTATATPTPAPSGTPNSCGGTCGSNSNCGNDLYCYNGYCRNTSCPSDTDCVCPTTSPTATATAKASTATPTPEEEITLPESGTSWPTIAGTGLGILIILGSILLAL